jgi:hypothetical protein
MQAHLLLNKGHTKVVPGRAMRGSKVSGGTTPLTLDLGTRQVKNQTDSNNIPVPLRK